MKIVLGQAIYHLEEIQREKTIYLLIGCDLHTFQIEPTIYDDNTLCSSSLYSTTLQITITSIR